MATSWGRSSRPANAADAFGSDRAAYGRFFGSMLDQGVLLPPSQFEAWFPSLVHEREQLEATLDAAREALATL